MSDGRPPVTPTRVPPSNLRAEESVLGAMLLSREAIADVVETLAPDHFYKPAHGHLYDAILGLYGAGQAVDVVTVAEELQRANVLEEIGGPSLLLDLQASTPAISNAAHYAKIVEEHALLRRLISVSNEIAEMAYGVPDDVVKAIDEAEARMFDVAQRRVTDTTAIIKDLLSANLDRLETLYERGEEVTGVRTGYLDLDDLLAGLQPNALYVIGARPGMGKALALDTPLATPEGWTTMGSVSVGDCVIDERGRPTVVTHKSPVHLHHRCYEVVFDDASVVVADAEHRWLTWARRDDEVRAVRTTDEIAATLLVWHDGANRPNHRVPVAQPLDLPEADLPIDPYLVGRFLARMARLDQLTEDRSSGVLELAASLELVDPAGNPRIPRDYLRAGIKQRLAFVQGMMDVAGEVEVDGSTCRLDLCHRDLVEDLRELVVSLGSKASPLREGVDRCGHRTWLLRFVPADPVFRLPYRARALHLVDGPDSRARWREIVAVRPIESVPVQCITVDSPEHLYLAGRDMIPTHNTAFALGMATNAAMNEQKPILFFSLEMSKLELSQRILCSEALVDSSRVKTGRIQEHEWTRIIHAVGRLADSPIYIDDNPHTSVMEIRAKARRLKSRVGELGMVVVDYIQLMTGRSGAESRQVEVSEISRNLKILARELETPVVALAQLNRQLEQRVDKRPMLSDLRESGSLEQDADVVMFLYREEMYDKETPNIKGLAEVIVAKHRNGPTGAVRLAFRGQYTKYDNMSNDTPPPDLAAGGPPGPPPEEF